MRLSPSVMVPDILRLCDAVGVKSRGETQVGRPINEGKKGYLGFLATQDAGAVAPGSGSSSRGATTVAASASETPRRGARAVKERAGASLRLRSAARRAGRRTWIHWLALLCPIPNKHPCTTWSAEVLRETRMKNRRSSGVGRGQFLYTLNWRAVRGFPSRRQAAIWAWNAASKGGTSC